MANSYFQFKQFTVHQDQCAMKVTTDGCLFGALAAKWAVVSGELSVVSGQLAIGNSESLAMVNELSKSENKLTSHDSQLTPHDSRLTSVLDIGSGTGLLSLMYAQDHENAIIDAVEIDKLAAEQCQHNFEASPWKERLKVHCISIQDFTKVSVRNYDLIISNPPFYEQQLKGNNAPKNIAHHSTGLSLTELFACVKILLNPLGYFVVLLPFYRLNEAIEIAETQHLFLQQQFLIKQTPKHDCFRAILFFSALKIETVLEKTITIKNEGNNYTPQFSELLGDYYLKL